MEIISITISSNTGEAIVKFENFKMKEVKLTGIGSCKEEALSSLNSKLQKTSILDKECNAKFKEKIEKLIASNIIFDKNIDLKKISYIFSHKIKKKYCISQNFGYNNKINLKRTN